MSIKLSSLSKYNICYIIHCFISAIFLLFVFVFLGLHYAGGVGILEEENISSVSSVIIEHFLENTSISGDVYLSTNEEIPTDDLMKMVNKNTKNIKFIGYNGKNSIVFREEIQLNHNYLSVTIFGTPVYGFYYVGVRSNSCIHRYMVSYFFNKSIIVSHKWLCA